MHNHKSLHKSFHYTNLLIQYGYIHSRSMSIYKYGTPLKDKKKYPLKINGWKSILSQFHFPRSFARWKIPTVVGRDLTLREPPMISGRQNQQPLSGVVTCLHTNPKRFKAGQTARIVWCFCFLTLLPSRIKKTLGCEFIPKKHHQSASLVFKDVPTSSSSCCAYLAASCKFAIMSV